MPHILWGMFIVVMRRWCLMQNVNSSPEIQEEHWKFVFILSWRQLYEGIFCSCPPGRQLRASMWRHWFSSSYKYLQGLVRSSEKEEWGSGSSNLNIKGCFSTQFIKLVKKELSVTYFKCLMNLHSWFNLPSKFLSNQN